MDERPSRRVFQQVTEEVESANRRLLELRRGIIELSRLTSATAMMNADEITQNDMARLRSSLPADVLSRVSQFEEQNRRAHLNRQTRTTDSTTASTDVPVRYRDDPSTSLGRHLAAREASLSTDNERDGLSTSEFSSSEEFTNRLLSTMVARVEARRASNASQADERRITQPRASLGELPPNSANPYARIRASQLEERRNSLTRQGTGTTTSSSRLSLLSNFSSVQNLATPAGIQRPMLFSDDPEHYDSEEYTPIDYSSSAYNIRRRLNANGEEIVYSIDSLWDEEEPENGSWIPLSRNGSLPVRPRRLPSRRTDAYQPPLAEEFTERRRRGWARLDADGNEIPLDEEEQLERSRELMRIHSDTVTRANAQLGTVSSDLVAQAFTPSSRTSLTQALDDENEALSFARVRLNSGNSRTSASSTRMARRPTGPQSRYRDRRPTRDVPENGSFYGSEIPWEIDPLPSPLEEMEIVHQKRHAIPAVPVAAIIFAGR